MRFRIVKHFLEIKITLPNMRSVLQKFAKKLFNSGLTQNKSIMYQY